MSDEAASPSAANRWKSKNAADFGWGADSTQHILWRLQHGELDGVHPKVIVILAGTNNVGRTPPSDEKIAEITRGLQAIVATCREKAPRATLVLTAIFPRNDAPGLVPGIERINQNLARLADEVGVTLDEVAEVNVAKLRARYPEGWSAHHAVARLDGEDAGTGKTYG